MTDKTNDEEACRIWIEAYTKNYAHTDLLKPNIMAKQAWRAAWEASRKSHQADAMDSVNELMGEIFSMETKIAGLVEALKFYAGNEHFELCGSLDNVPETVRGEPMNWERGGDDDHAYMFENGGIAREALKKFDESKYDK